MEKTRFRFIVSQKSGNAWSVFLFILIFSLIMIVMVDYLVRNELSENQELIVITIVVFGQFFLFIPFFLRISRGPATIGLHSNGLSLKLDKPKLLLSFTELDVPFSAIESYDLAEEGNPGLVFRLKNGKKGFILHQTPSEEHDYQLNVKQILTAIEEYNVNADESEGILYRSVYTTPLMRGLAILFFILIIAIGALLFTQPETELTYQVVYFSAIGLAFMWQVLGHWRKR